MPIEDQLTEGAHVYGICSDAIAAAERAPKADHASWLRGRIELHEATARHLEEDQAIVAYVVSQLVADAGIGGELVAAVASDVRKVVAGDGLRAKLCKGIEEMRRAMR